MWEAVTTGLRERQRASVEVERLVEAQSGLRKWRNSIEVRERKEEF